jgi:excisionase family DNA binding protein
MFLTVKAVAELLSVDPGKVCDWIAHGYLDAVNVAEISGGIKPRWRISREALDAFLASRQSTKPVAAPPRQKSEVTSKYY